MPAPVASRRTFGITLALLTVVFVALAIWLFPKAQPTIALRQTLTREMAIQRARDFALARGLPIDSTRVAVRFEHDDDTQTFIELEAGGKAAVNTEVNGHDVLLFSWTVRFFRPGDPREVRVMLAPDGTVTGFARRLATVDLRPALDSTAAFALADSVRTQWIGLGATAWRRVSSSVDSVQPSGRLDRTVSSERTDRKLGEAPLRIDVQVRGDLAGGARQYVKVPESFTRRYSERRADNELYSQIAAVFAPIFALLGVGVLIGAARRRAVRWRPALAVGGVIGIALAAAQLNDISGSWFVYNTAVAPGTHLAQQWLIALVVAVLVGLASAVLLATGELLTREAFPGHFDWWQTVRYAGTRPIARRVLGGYTLAAFGLAYVSVFYLLMERGFGWWSPSSLLDDPNLIASPLPWLSAVANSLQAGVLEEVLFRAIPLALIARAVGSRPWRPLALGGGVVLTALVFGFAHANYPSWPAYARGVELFVEASLWAVLFLRVGLITTIVSHFTYDLVLFGLFAAAGTALPYRITLAVVVLVVALPALVVLVQRLRARAPMGDAPASARFAGWQAALPVPDDVTAERPAPVAATSSPVTLRRATSAAAVLAILLGFVDTRRPAPPRFTVGRAHVEATADSLLRELGGAPEGWTRLIRSETSWWARERRFLTEHHASPLAESLASRYLHAGQWSVRYVHTRGTVAQRTEAWSIAISPDGRRHGWEHIIPDSAAAPDLERGDAEAMARQALAAMGAQPGGLVLLSAKETAKPARLDVAFEFEDTTVALPAGASARHTVTVAGNRVIGIGHRIFLPEAWERADAKRMSTRGIASAASGVTLILAALAGLFAFWRRRPSLPPAARPPRAQLVTLVAVACVATVVLGINSWPAEMSAWNSASPFNRHQWTTAVGLAARALIPFAVWGLWLAADGVRRRLGVSIRAESARDAWVGGVALSLAMALPSALMALLYPLPVVPVETVLGTAVPVADNLLAGIGSALLMVPSIVLVAATALAVRPAALRAVLLVFAALGVGVIMAGGNAITSAEWMSRIGAQAAGVGGAIAVIWYFGRSSMETWFVAGIVSTIGSQLGDATLAASSQDRISIILSVVVTVVFAWLVVSRRRDVDIR